MKIVSTKKLLAVFLALLVFASSMLNVSIVWGSEEDLSATFNRKVSVVDNGAIGKVDDGVAYVKKEVDLYLNLQECNWEDIDSISLIGSKLGIVETISEKGNLIVSNSDTYSLGVNMKDGGYENIPLKDLVPFGTVEKDLSGVDLKDISVDGVSVLGGKWITSLGDIKVTLTALVGEITGYSFSINGYALNVFERKGNDFIFPLGTFSSYIVGGRNTFSISVGNKYGSNYSDLIPINYDNSELAINDSKIEGKQYLIDDDLYVEEGANATVDINTGLSGLGFINIFNNEETYAHDKEFTINKEGKYSAEVCSVSGKSVSKELFNGKNIKFDKDKPVCDSMIYNDDIADYSKWYNELGVLSFSYSDNIGLKEKCTVNINGTDYPLTFTPTETDDLGLVKEGTYSINMSTVTQDQKGTYVISIFVRDVFDNVTTYSNTIHIDVAKPTYKGIIVDNTIKEGNIYYIPDDIEVKGSFSDEASGVKSVYFKDSKEGSYNEVSLPLNSVPQDGYFKVSDNAGNTIEYSVKELLRLLGISSFIVDKDTPVIKRDALSEDYKKGSTQYFKSVPTISYTITDANMKSVDFYVNGVKQESGFETSNVYKFKPNGITDGSVSVKVVATDMVNHTTSNEYTFVLDTLKPTNISVKTEKPVNTKGDIVYYNNSIDLKISAEDETSGIKGYKLNNKSSLTGEYAISEDGEYAFEVTDNVGNSTGLLNIKDYVDWGGNKVVIDSKKPTISTSRPTGESNYKKDWYGKDVTYTITLADNKGIDSAYVTINGVKVGTFSTKLTDVKSAILKADTSKVSPSKDGSYCIEVYVEDNAKLSASWSDTIYIDKTSPKVTGFVINGVVNGTGKTLGGSDSFYSFFFNGNGSVQIEVEDKNHSSGIRSILYKYGDTEWKELKTKGDTVINVPVPTNFKGNLYAYTVDNVGHKSKVDKPDSFVSESKNTHINHSKVILNLDTSNHYDSNNLPLYNSDVNCKAKVNCDWSGIKKLEWGINDKTYGTVTDFSKASKWDKNLPLEFNTALLLKGNSNSMELWVKVTDNSNYISENSRKFSIDKDSPILNISYDVNNENNYYNTTRVAKVTVEERNFSTSDFKIEGTSGVLGSWSKLGNVWSNTITFNEDGDYEFSVSCKDKAGNLSKIYKSDKFTVDKTNPLLTVTWDNSDVKNGDYYSSGRTATIVVKEHNFDESLINIAGGTISGWSNTGDTHTVTISFNSDGKHSLSVSGKDMANNNINNSYDSGSFIIDTSKPEILIEGVEKGISYKKDVSIYAELNDAYIDMSRSVVSLKGKNHDEIILEGTLSDSSLMYMYDSFKTVKSIDDIYTLSLKAVDLAGNEYSESIVFSVNRFGSKYDFFNKNLLGNFTNKPEDVKISEYNVDKLDTSKVKVLTYLNGDEIKNTKDFTTVSEKEVKGKYVYSYNIDKKLFKKDGLYTIQVYSSSKDGTNYSSVAEEYEFGLDTTDSEIMVQGIESEGKYQDYSKNVTIDVRDFSGVKTIKALLNGKNVKLKYANSSYNLSIPESNDYQTLKVSVVDNAGNSTHVIVGDFMITSNQWVYLWNQLWFKVFLIGVGVLILLLIVILILRKRKSTKEEIRIAKESGDYYKSSSSGSSNNVEENQTDVATSVVDNTDTSFAENSVDNSETDIID